MRLGLVVPSLAALVLVAGCGGSPAPTSSPAPTTTSASPAPTPEPELSPLTGLPVVGALPDHPVYVVKVDNTQAARPQVGVDDADLVVEELVEGGLTRLAALFWSQTPAAVGPVRSMRATDVSIAKPANATVIASGGAVQTIDRIRAAEIPILSEDTGQLDVLTKSPDRRAPYDRLLDLGDVAGRSQDVPPVKPYLPFGDAAASPGTDPARAFTVRFSGGAGTRWALDDDHYVRQNGLAAPGEEFRADNVLVLRAPVTSAGYVDAAGNGVPETVLTGKGRFTLFHAGRSVEGRWYKASPEARLQLKTLDRTDLEVPAGRTWIELVPSATGVVTVTDPG